jgi:ribA/ribD-fused uncharacterized protein
MTPRPSRSFEYDRLTSAIFLRTHEENGALSNMAGGFPLLVNGIQIATSEALYQACRFPHLPEVQKLIIAEPSPMSAKMKSKPHRDQTRPDWDQVRIPIMRWCIRVKLIQNWSPFSAALKATSPRPIVEQSRRDTFWGALETPEGRLRGENHLGRLLTDLREDVLSRKIEPNAVVKPPNLSDFRLFGLPISDVKAPGRSGFGAGMRFG